MFDFYEKRKLKGIIFSRITAGLLFTLAILLSVSAYERYTAELATREKRTASFTELEELKLRAQLLESKVSRMESERGIEEEIREQFDVVKENEQVVVIVDPASARTGSSQPEVFPLPPKPSLLEWFKFW